MSARIAKQVVVVLDDDEILLKLVSRRLRETEHEVHCFLTPAECTAALSKIEPDKVFIDHRLPEMSGIAFRQLLIDSKLAERATCYLWSAAELPDDVATAAADLGITVLHKDILRARDDFLQLLESS